jgi:signal transduction histidine kinase
MFRLLRYFSLTSLVALVVTLAATLWFARETAIGHLRALGEENNIALTRAFANTLWPLYGDFFAHAAELDGDAIRAHATTKLVDRDIHQLAAGLTVLKVKVFSLSGNTIYSSDPGQIGERRPTHPAIIRARDGRVTSDLIERGRFSAMDGERGQVHLISSYVPVRSPDGRITGVFEVYNDITALVAQMNRELAALALRLGPAFALLYLALFLIVYRGDRLLRQQYAQLRDGREQARAQSARLEKEMAERQRAERELLTLREVEVSQRAMRALVANLSHELRTPLNAIIGFSQLIAHRHLGDHALDRYTDYAADIERSGQHLLSIINTMLDLAKAEAGQMELDEERFDLEPVAAECLRMLAQRAHDAGVALSHSLPSDLPPLFADKRIVRQVLLNLLSNAVKFTPRGGRVTVLAAVEPDRSLRLEVADTGIGIAPELIPRVMSPFGQVDDDLNRRHQGTGLGLPIVRSMMELHGGVFRLESMPGKGTRAIAVFPAHRLICEEQAA